MVRGSPFQMSAIFKGQPSVSFCEQQSGKVNRVLLIIVCVILGPRVIMRDTGHEKLETNEANDIS